MQIHTTARHCDLDPEDRLFAQQRLERLTRYAHDLREARVVVTAERYRHQVEITLALTGRELVSKEESSSARLAIDLACGHLERQLTRVKDKRVSRKRARPGASGAAEPAAAEDGGGEDAAAFDLGADDAAREGPAR